MAQLAPQATAPSVQGESESAGSATTATSSTRAAIRGRSLDEQIQMLTPRAAPTRSPVQMRDGEAPAAAAAQTEGHGAPQQGAEAPPGARPPEAAPGQVYRVQVGGQWYTATAEQFEQICDAAIQGLERPAVQMKMRAVGAESLWDHFNHLRNDQNIVSWISESIGSAQFPPHSLIRRAMSEARAVERASRGSGIAGLRTLTREMRTAEPHINEAINTMNQYQERVIAGATMSLRVLRAAQGAGFLAANALASTVLIPAGAGMGAIALTSAGIGGVLGAIRNSVEQGQDIAAGGQQDFEGGQVIEAAVVGAAAGAISGPVASRFAHAVAAPLAARLGRGITEHAVEQLLHHSAHHLLEHHIEHLLHSGIHATEPFLEALVERLAHDPEVIRQAQEGGGH